ncbi:Trihelix transcription factor ASIL2 [Spatholobus suberectus]|nr:Trihelix transcription factor ASIL2 [Spatholobus suberectus]
MDDDDEIQSHPSPASGSPASSPRANGRITVTVAAPAPPAPNSLALALPIQQPAKGNGGGGGGREDCWSEGATAVLIDAWGDRYLELSRGNLKQKHWKEVAEIVSGREDYTKAPKTDIQCKNRIDTVKKKYKSEKAKIAAGATSKWPFFDRLDQLIGPTAKSGSGGTSAAGNSNLPPQKVPLGIPVGVRGGANQYHHPQKPPQQPPQQPQPVPSKNQKIQFRRRGPPVESDSSERDASSPGSSDSFPPESFERKRPRMMSSSAAKGRETGRKGKGWGSAVRELTQAILKFGEAYEQAESSKLQQVVEMEKQRMKFAKDLELQRMQFFMKTQLEISQLKLGRKGANPSNHHSTNTNNNNNNNHNNNSDSE